MTNKEARTLMKAHGHKFAYCSHCNTPMIFCGNCHNNTCNGSYGNILTGESCSLCEEAYDIDNAVKHPWIHRFRADINYLKWKFIKWYRRQAYKKHK